MARKINTDGQVGWVAWGSLIICMGALFVILRSALSEAFAREFGVILVSATATAGLITAARCRRFGLLTGLTLPVVFGLALALNWVSDPALPWRMAGLGVGIYLALVGGRVALAAEFLHHAAARSVGDCIQDLLERDLCDPARSGDLVFAGGDRLGGVSADMAAGAAAAGVDFHTLQHILPFAAGTR